jgi:peptidoglycan/xylan/chitin deacetylase (PgdA/CDA1 family)
LTFDDGYEDFFTHVFPLLKEQAVPATLFVTTGFVEGQIAHPFSITPSAAVRPVTWDMLGKMQESGLVTLGAHTHTHPNLVGASQDRIADELAYPIELFRARLGVSVSHFAYPRAKWNGEAEALVKKFYASAVIGEGKKATTRTFDPHRIPRVPVRRSDGWLFFKAKLRGWLKDEETVYAYLKGVAN